MPNELRMLILYALYIMIALILAEVIVANIIAFGGRVSPYHPWVRLLRKVVNPILNPVRRILPSPHNTGGWDFAPLIVIVLLQLICHQLR